jgi:hypothetical protein
MFVPTTKGQLGCEQFFEHFELRDKTGQQHTHSSCRSLYCNL